MEYQLIDFIAGMMLIASKAYQREAPFVSGHCKQIFEMKIRLLVLILLVSQIGYSQSDKLNEEKKMANINNVIALFKQGDIEKISDIINYPLHREYPIPSIESKKEFIQRFSEVFDNALVDKIAYSKIEQWSEVGWRGIMLDNGVLWIDSYKGKITAITSQSDFEKKLKNDSITKEKEALHISLRIFESPIYKIKTKNYLIRIDKLSDYKYRYASWKINEKESSKPDVVLTNGQVEYQGSGGNHVFTFSNNNYVYKVYRNIIGADASPDITLEVEKEGQTILTEGGTLIE